MAEYFSDFESADFVAPVDGVKVKSVSLDNVMMTYMEFEPNAVLPEHAHPHEQITMIHEGRLEMTVDGQTQVMEKGDVVVGNIRTFASAAELFRLRTGQYLEDSGSGTCPAGFEDYIQQNKWENGTSLGGVWDAELNSFGITSAIGVHFNGQGTTRNAAYMQEVDQMFDDGDLATGGFRQLAGDRYYYIISD